MATESEIIKKGVESPEGIKKRDYRITIPESANNAGLKEVEDFLNVNPSGEFDIVPDEPPVPVSVMSNESKNALAIEAGAINEHITKTDHFKALDEALKTMNPKATLYQNADTKVSNDINEIENTFANTPYATVDDMQRHGEAAIQAMGDKEKERLNPHLAYVKAIMNAPTGGEEIAYKANQLKLLEMIRDITDNMSGWDKFKGFVGLIVPGNTLKDSYDISGDAFAGEEFFRNLVLNYKKADPLEQAEMLPVIKKELFDTLDNPLKVQTVLEAMLQPSGENDLEMFSNLWAAFEVTELASLGLSAGIRIANLTKALNAVKVAKELNNVDRASKLATGAIVDGRLAEVYALDRTELTNLGSPFNMERIDPAYVEGLSSEIIQDINQFTKDAANLQDELRGNDYFLREGLLDKADRSKTEAQFIEGIKSSDNVEDVRVVNRTGTTSTVEYMVDGVKQRATLQFKLDDVGEYDNVITTMLNNSIFSPEVTAKGELKLATAAAQRLDHAQSRVFNHLTKFHRMAHKDILGPMGLKGLTPSGRRQLAQLDHVLKVGDARKEVYTTAELKAGVDGVKLNDKQISAYYKVRALVDAMHSARNFEMRNEMTVRGFKNLNITDDIQEVGKPFQEYQNALASLSSTRPQEIFDASLGRGVPLSRIDLEAEYAAGRRLVRLEESSSFQQGGAEWHYVLVNAEDITDLPANVLNYRTGYVPKVNVNTEYYVKNIRSKTVDGIEGRGKAVSTLRVFDNRADAQRYADSVAGEVEGSVRVLEERQLEKESRALGAGFDESHSLGGSLYTGSRKDEQLLFGLEGTPVETLGAFEAIGRNIANLSRYIPRNEWRMGLEQKAINTANAILPETSRVTQFSQLAHLPDTQQGRYLKWLHRQIEDWLGFPTKEEQLWQNSVQRMYETALVQKAPDIVKKSIQYVKHKDPIANARSAAFHSLLGWFNPVQLWVQAQGAAVSLSANIFKPAELAAVIKDQMALAASRYSQNPETLAHVAKAFGMKADDLAELQGLWLKSGLEDSILITADHAAAMQGHNVAMDALARTSNSGLYFYRKGEMFNRRTAFITSVREWKANNAGKVIDDVALKDILKRSNDYLLNLGKANRAAFQKGAFGVTTQFLQVSTKTMETLLGLNGNFTAAERAKIFTTQMLLYGSAGLGINSLGSRIVAGSLGYDNQAAIENEMTPEQRKLYNEGVLGWATLAMFGADIDIGKRSSLLSGVAEFTDRMLFDDTEFVEMALGAFGSTANRFWTGMTDTLRPVLYGSASVLDIDPIRATRKMLSTISSWSNIEKAMYMHNLNALMTRKGKIIRRRDFTAMEEISQAIGFSLSEEKQYYEIDGILRAKQQFEAKIVDNIVQAMHQYAVITQSGNASESDKKDIEEFIALQYQIMPTAKEQLDLRNSVESRLTKNKDEYSRVWNKFIKEFNDGRVADLVGMHTKLSSYGIQQQIKPEE